MTTDQLSEARGVEPASREQERATASDLWARAHDAVAQSDWPLASVLGEQAVMAAYPKAPGNDTDTVAACLQAARWAKACSRSEAVRSLLIKALDFLEQREHGPWDATEANAFCVSAALLDKVLPVEEGAKLLESHPRLWGLLFYDDWLLHRLVDPVECKLLLSEGSEESARGLLALSAWALEWGRPAEALALSRMTETIDDPELSERAKSQSSSNQQRVSRLQRQAHLLDGVIRVVESFSRDQRLLSWPRRHEVLLAEAHDDDHIFKKSRPKTAEHAVTSAFELHDSSGVVVRMARLARTSRPNSSNGPDGMWEWETGRTWESFLASPLQWGFVYVFPLAWLMLVYGIAGNHVASSLEQPFALAVLMPAWLWAVSMCRVMRFVKLSPSYKDVAWVGVPVPLFKLSRIKILCQDAMATNEYVDDAMAQLRVRRQGAFVSINGTHHRRDEIASWGMKTKPDGLYGLCLVVGAMFVLPLLALGAYYGVEYLMTHRLLQALVAAPVYMLLLGVIILGWLGAAGAAWASGMVVLTGVIFHKSFDIGMTYAKETFKVSYAFDAS